MSSRGKDQRGRGRGSVRMYRSRNDPAKAQEQNDRLRDEGLRITVPNVPSEKLVAHQPIFDDMRERSPATPKFPSNKPSVQDRLGPQKLPDVTDESIRITVGNDKYRERSTGSGSHSRSPSENSHSSRTERDSRSHEKSRPQERRTGGSAKNSRDSGQRGRDDVKEADRSGLTKSSKDRNKDVREHRDDRTQRERKDRSSREPRDRSGEDVMMSAKARSSSSRSTHRHRRESPRDRSRSRSPGSRSRGGSIHSDHHGPAKDSNFHMDIDYRNPLHRSLPLDMQSGGTKPQIVSQETRLHQEVQMILSQSQGGDTSKAGVANALKDAFKGTPWESKLQMAMEEAFVSRQQNLPHSSGGMPPTASSVAKLLPSHMVTTSGWTAIAKPPPPETKPKKSILKKARSPHDQPTPPIPQPFTPVEPVVAAGPEDNSTGSITDNLLFFKPKPFVGSQLSLPGFGSSSLEPEKVADQKPPISSLGNFMNVDDEDLFLYGDDEPNFPPSQTGKQLPAKEPAMHGLNPEPPMRPQVQAPNVIDYGHTALVQKTYDSPASTSVPTSGLNVPTSASGSYYSEVTGSHLFPISNREIISESLHPVLSEITKEKLPEIPKPVLETPIESESEKKASYDPTIENILKSIGFNFELSKIMQEKAKKERELKENEETPESMGIEQGSSFIGSGLKDVDISQVFDEKQAQLIRPAPSPNQPKKSKIKSSVLNSQLSYEERARRYREEEMRGPPDQIDTAAKRKSRNEGDTNLEKLKTDYDEIMSSDDDKKYADGRKKRKVKKRSNSLSSVSSRSSFSSSGSSSSSRSRSRTSKSKRSRSRSKSRSRSRSHIRSPSPESDNLHVTKHSGDFRDFPRSFDVPPIMGPIGTEQGHFHPGPYGPGPGMGPMGMSPGYAMGGPRGPAGQWFGLYGPPDPSGLSRHPGASRHLGPSGPLGPSGAPGPSGPPANAPKTERDLEWERLTEEFIRKQGSDTSGKEGAKEDKEKAVSQKTENSPIKEKEKSLRKEGRREDRRTERPARSRDVVTSSTEKTSKRTVLPPKSASNRSADSGKPAETRKVISRDLEIKRDRERQEQDKSKLKLQQEITSSSLKQRELLRKEMDARQKRLRVLERELDRLRRQQNELMRKKQRQKDGHKDPLLLENSKLQEEIAVQISNLRKAADENVKTLESETTAPKDHNSTSIRITEDKPEGEGDTDTVRRIIKVSSSSGDADRSQTTVGSSPVEEDEPKKAIERKPQFQVRFDYFDPGNHWCPKCNQVYSSVFDFFDHLHGKQHKANMDTADVLKKPPVDEKPKFMQFTKTLSAPFKGVEFLAPVETVYCSICHMFSGDNSSAEEHMKSEEHNKKYQEYLNENPFYEKRFLLDKAAGLSRMTHSDREKLKEKVAKQEEERGKRKAAITGEDQEKEQPKKQKAIERSRRFEEKTKVSVEKEKLHEIKSPIREKVKEEKPKPVKRPPIIGKMPSKANKRKAELAPKSSELVIDVSEKTAKSRVFMQLAGKNVMAKQAPQLNPLAIIKKEIKPHQVLPKEPAFLSKLRHKEKEPEKPIPEEVEQNVDQKNLDKFLSIGQSKSVPVFQPIIPKEPPPEEKKKSPPAEDIQDPKYQETNEDLKLLGIEPEAESTVTPKPPPALALANVKPPASMSTSTASNLYNVFFSKSDKKTPPVTKSSSNGLFDIPLPSIATSTPLETGNSAAAGIVSQNEGFTGQSFMPNHSIEVPEEQGNTSSMKTEHTMDCGRDDSRITDEDVKDAVSEGSGVDMMDMGSDFEILDECE